MDWPAVVVLVVATLGVGVTIGVAVRRTPVKRQPSREELHSQAQLLCPHIQVLPPPPNAPPNQLALVQSLFYSPPGTVALICKMCQGMTLDENAGVDASARLLEALRVEPEETIQKLQEQWDDFHKFVDVKLRGKDEK